MIMFTSVPFLTPSFRRFDNRYRMSSFAVPLTIDAFIGCIILIQTLDIAYVSCETLHRNETGASDGSNTTTPYQTAHGTAGEHFEENGTNMRTNSTNGADTIHWRNQSGNAMAEGESNGTAFHHGRSNCSSEQHEHSPNGFKSDVILEHNKSKCAYEEHENSSNNTGTNDDEKYGNGISDQFDNSLDDVFGNYSNSSKKVTLTLAGFTEIDIIPDGWASGGVVPAIEMAFEDVNSRDDILQGYNLQWEFMDTRCDPGLAIKYLFEHVRNPPIKLMILGGGCSVATSPVARAAQYFNFVELSYATGSPEFTDRTKFPTFLRTAPSDVSLTKPMLSILMHYKWAKVATLHENDPLFAMTMDQLHLFFDETNITIITSESFKTDPATQLDNIRAYRRNMYGPHYQWLIPGWWDENWPEKAESGVDCSPEEIRLALNCSFVFETLNYDTSGKPGISNMTYKQYQERYVNWPTYKKYGYNDYHPNAYDAVWAIALALDNTQNMIKDQNVTVVRNGKFITRGKRLEDYTYNDPMMSLAIFTSLMATQFHGVSGNVSFDKSGDRRPTTQVKQVQNGIFVPVAIYYEDQQRLAFNPDQPVQWNGKGPPLDSIRLDITKTYLNGGLFIGASVLSSLGICLAVGFLIFNISHMHYRYIKMSSPRLNNLITVGCILGYFSVILLGLDGYTVDSEYLHLVCASRNWVLTLAFTCAFGAMFAKTWRVHGIFTSRTLASKALHDIHLFLFVGVVLLIDAAILTAWQITDPLFVAVLNGTMQETETEMILQQLEYCDSVGKFYWMGTLYVLKGLMLIFGCFLAYETRQVHVPGLNDSKYIGICVYNVVAMCIIGVTITMVIYDETDISFIFAALSVLFCSTLTLCLVFIPKIRHLRTEKKQEQMSRLGQMSTSNLSVTENSATFNYTMKKVMKQVSKRADHYESSSENLSSQDIQFRESQRLLELKNKKIEELTRRVQNMDNMMKSMSLLEIRSRTSSGLSGWSTVSTASLSRRMSSEEKRNIPRSVSSCQMRASDWKLY